MSVRDRILRAMTEPNSWGHYTPEMAASLLDAFRAEEATEFEAYPGELAMLRGVLGVVRAIARHGELGDTEGGRELRRIVAEHYADERAAYAERGEKDTREGESTPQPAPAADLPLWLNSPIECPHCGVTQQNCDTCGVDMYKPTDEGGTR